MAKPIIFLINPRSVPSVVKLYGRMLVKSLATAGETDMRGCITDFIIGRRQLWAIFHADKPGPLAFFRTEIIIDDTDGPWICLSALAGCEMKLWARELSDHMAVVAKETGCKSFCFAGSKAWGRVLPECKVVGQLGPNTLYERAAA